MPSSSHFLPKFSCLFFNHIIFSSQKCGHVEKFSGSWLVYWLKESGFCQFAYHNCQAGISLPPPVCCTLLGEQAPPSLINLCFNQHYILDKPCLTCPEGLSCCARKRTGIGTPALQCTFASERGLCIPASLHFGIICPSTVRGSLIAVVRQVETGSRILSRSKRGADKEILEIEKTLCTTHSYDSSTLST
jgi:hypothetical protein